MDSDRIANVMRDMRSKSPSSSQPTTQPTPSNATDKTASDIIEEADEDAFVNATGNIQLELSGGNGDSGEERTQQKPETAGARPRRRMFGFRRLDDDAVATESGVRSSGRRGGRTKSPLHLPAIFGIGDGGGDDLDDNSFVPHIMPEQEIMHKYWKLAVRKRDN